MNTEATLISWWELFVDPEKRMQLYREFLTPLFKSYNVQSVLDLATGSGVDSILLIKEGFEVTSNEVNKQYAREAISFAKQYHTQLTLTHHDWLHIPSTPKYDAAILLGNSLVYIKNNQRKQILKNFFSLLKPGGILIIDHRNFAYIYESSEHILQNPLNFRYTRSVNYCGTQVSAYPIAITPDHVIFEYYNHNLEEKAYLTHYPVFEQTLTQQLQETGFTTTTYYDLKQKSKHYDFVHHVCIKAPTSLNNSKT